jgi:predicted nucleotidyltransferase
MNKTKAIQNILLNQPTLELALLIGSQSNNQASEDSDWDIAIQWARGMTVMEQLYQTEQLRQQLAGILGISDAKIDLIDIPRAGLAMREVVANEGILLKGENTLALSHFLLRTWRQLEEFYWEKIYAT